MVGGRSFTKNNTAQLIRNGQEFMRVCLELIDEAKEKILCHTYIFKEDEITKPFVEGLAKKSREGVKVFFLLDAFGSPELSSDLKRQLEDDGVNWAWFSPFWSKDLKHIGRRLHQKVMIIDNHKAVVAGMNIAKEFIAPKDDQPWLDYGVLIHGEEVYRLQRKIKGLYRKSFPRYRAYFANALQKDSFSFPAAVEARTVVNDFMRFKSEISHSYIHAISQADHSVKITATYFHPGKKLLKAIKQAVKRGVQVELVFGERSDHQFERWSSRYLYPWYLKHHLKVYEWTDSIMHAKAAVIDGRWVSIGSYNHNYVSRYGCVELNMEIISEDFGRQMEEEFDFIKQSSREVSLEKDCPWYLMLFYFLTYTLSNIIRILSMAFIVQRKEKPESL